MRTCLIGDLIEAAHAIARLPADQRAAFAQSLVTQADAAHRYAKRFARAHPVWGNGSLMARALIERPDQAPGQRDQAFFAALAVLANLLADRAALALNATPTPPSCPCPSASPYATLRAQREVTSWPKRTQS